MPLVALFDVEVTDDDDDDEEEEVECGVGVIEDVGNA